jgi:hypothetical protein
MSADEFFHLHVYNPYFSSTRLGHTMVFVYCEAVRSDGASVSLADEF